MSDIFIDNIALITFLPLWIFLIIMCGRFLSVYVNKFVIYALTLISSLSGIAVSLITLTKINEAIVWSTPFIQVKNFIIPIGIQADKLSLIIALVLFTISFLVQVFSISYMKDEKKNYRFFALLNLFNFGMSALLFSPNMFQMYVFWELVGIVSYLLIGFNYTNNTKSEASKRVFLINRIGDTALIGGIVLSSYFMYSYVADKSLASLSFEHIDEISLLLSVYTSTPEFLVITGLFILAAIVKSAQLPFYNWLQDAMEAEIPVSALLHSATMVVAGIYLTIRLLPIFTLNSVLMKGLIIIGLLTTLICSILASIEINPKKILAYSTSANLGLMFFALGLENVKAAILFLIAHAFIKSMLFLDLPDKNNNISYLEFLFFLLGGLSLGGIIFAGLSTKEYIYVNIQNPFILSLFIICSFLTAFYIIRLSLLIFKNSELVKKVNLTEFIPVTILLILNIVFYFRLKVSLEYSLTYSFYAGLLGCLTATILYKFNILDKFNKAPKIIEYIYNNVLPKIYQKISAICDNIDTKIFGNYKPIRKISGLFVNIAGWIETNVMNRTVTTTSDILKGTSKIDSILQSKNIQTYNSYAFIIITMIITLLILSYKLILKYMS